MVDLCPCGRWVRAEQRPSRMTWAPTEQRPARPQRPWRPGAPDEGVRRAASSTSPWGSPAAASASASQVAHTAAAGPWPLIETPTPRQHHILVAMSIASSIQGLVYWRRRVRDG